MRAFAHILKIAAVAVLLLLGGCGEDRTSLERIVERGELHFVTRNSPSTYYLGRDGPTGFEYELASALAKDLGVELVVHQSFTIDGLFEALKRGEADIAGAGLSLTEQRRRAYSSSLPFASQQPQVIYKVGEAKPRRIADLQGRSIAVAANSSHENLLQALRDDGRDWLQWSPINTADPMELLVLVRDDEVDVAIVDSRDFLLQQTLVPRLERAFDIGTQRDIVWFLDKRHEDSVLLERIDGFLADQQTGGQLAALSRKHFSRDEDISRVDSQTFVRGVRRNLNNYRGLIEAVAQEHQIPWELLAAISYQESHWDPEATSRTGVRGMMMLTLPTATELGVTDRTDPAQSLHGGARYFKNMRRRLPTDIAEPDRSWMALAAYNVGMGHLEDARVLTERRGGDPHLWRDVMDTLPLLEESEHYRTLRYGYARGLEAVRYVQNIRHYYDILRWQSARDARPRPPVDSDSYLPAPLRNLRLLAL